MIDLLTAVATFLAATLFLATSAWSQVEYDHMRAEGKLIQQTEVAPGVYVFMTLRDSYVRMLNSTAVITDHDVLVFDTDTRPSTATLKMSDDLHAAVIVPGHGPVFRDNTFMDLERQFIEAIIDGVAKARATGVQSLEDLQRAV